MDLLIGFTGPPGCGKDAAVDHLVTHHDFRQVAFADPIRQAALALNPMVDTFYKLDEVVRAWGWTDAKHRWPEEPWAEKPSLKTKNAFSRSEG